LKIVDEIYDEICSTYKHIYPRSFEVEILKDSIQNYEIDRNYARENALNQLEKNKNNLNSKQYKEAIEEIDDIFKFRRKIYIIEAIEAAKDVKTCIKDFFANVYKFIIICFEFVAKLVYFIKEQVKSKLRKYILNVLLLCTELQLEYLLYSAPYVIRSENLKKPHIGITLVGCYTHPDNCIQRKKALVNNVYADIKLRLEKKNSFSYLIM
ncbi:44529_t:CDS:2, partial [Gigaspora margarita]